MRKFFFSKGLRFRKNDNRYPGHPDIVLPKYKTIVFVHGCFWHMHEGCKYAVMPSSNVAYWTNKLLGNKERDARVKQELEENGWNVLVVWECQLKGSLKEITISNLYNALTGQ